MADLQKIEQRRVRRREKGEKEMKAHSPVDRGHLYKKRHLKESLQDFRKRRKASNHRQRERVR